MSAPEWYIEDNILYTRNMVWKNQDKIGVCDGTEQTT
jgi:hypothetical protein